MGFTHVGHDARVGNKVIMANGALVAGHVMLEDQVFLSALTAVHQFCRVGRLALVSGLSAVNQDVPPFMIAGGRPAEISGPNQEGLLRAGFDEAARRALHEAYRILFRGAMPRAEAIAALEAGGVTPEVRHLLDFLGSSECGICRPPARARGPGPSAAANPEDPAGLDG